MKENFLFLLLLVFIEICIIILKIKDELFEYDILLIM